MVVAFSDRWTMEALFAAWARLQTSRAEGHDRRRASAFGEAQLRWILADTLGGAYRPAPLRRVVLRGDRGREIGIPGARDQVVLGAWAWCATPLLEPLLASHVWGFRPGRSRFGALRALCAPRVDGPWSLVRCDVRRLFPSLPHELLAEAVAWAWPTSGKAAPPEAEPSWRRRLKGLGVGATAQEGADPLAWRLVRTWLDGWQAGVGVPTGVSPAPLWANACLALHVDRWVSARLADGTLHAAVRYGDDLALLARGDGRDVLAGVDAAVRRSGLRLNAAKTRVHGVTGGVWPARVLGVELVPDATGCGLTSADAGRRGGGRPR